MANRQLIEKIKAVHSASYETYGSPRVFSELRAQGMACSRNRVARLMRLYHVRAKQVRRYKVTTRRNPAHPVAPNVLKQDFEAERPDHKWLADITYIPTLQGWLYLATILDLYARRVVGWAMSHRMTSDLTLAALHMAIQRRQPAPGLIHHSDQGSQYTDRAYQALLKDYGIQASMNGKGSWYDNAPMESFFGSLKSELSFIIVSTAHAPRHGRTCSSTLKPSTTGVDDTRRWAISARRHMSSFTIRRPLPLNSLSTKPGEGLASA
jgi:transposase InsO family protein